MYDYIVVGAGSAGCVLANRLTENPNVTVLLLEAGGPDKKQEIHIPAAFSKLFKTSMDWAYFTEPQPQAANRQLYWPRGKMLGGSSSLNAMIYIRGHRADYDSWREAGNEGWGYSDVLPYFRKGETNERGADEYHGLHGPLNVADLRCINPLSKAFVEAAAGNGIPRNPDFNGAEQEGAGFYQVTQKQGKRHSTAAAYLKPVLSRSNLTVTTEAQVTRLLFEGKRVIGVAYIQNGVKQEAKAAAEVILAGGTINSPQVLLLSGVGPAEELRELGIEVVLDLPGVGKNLQDHLATAANYYSTKPVTLEGAESLKNVANYLVFRKGPLTTNVAEVGGFVRTRADLPAPDLQFHFAPGFFVEHGFVKPVGNGFTFGPTLLQPESRGYISLKSTDPLAHPKIQPNYFSAENDVKVLVEGIKIARKLAKHSAFAPYLGEEYLPGAAVTSDEALADYVRNKSETLYHPVGTCKMGNDAMAVVDSQLRVHGLEGLRVVDASIMPQVVRGNTNAPTIMIAEKAADLIKASRTTNPLTVGVYAKG